MMVQNKQETRVDERELFRLWNQCATTLVGYRVELRSAEERSAILGNAVARLESAVKRIGAAFTARALMLDSAPEALEEAFRDALDALSSARAPGGAK